MSSSVATLLFTDIEGSTRLWEAVPDAMSRALALHDDIARGAVAAHRGVVVKMTGDGMYAAFDDPLDAVAATTSMQAQLDALAQSVGVPIRVRAGLHAGIVERRNDDLFGTTANRAARIMKAAHGGQILVSLAVADGVRGRLAEPVALRDLGSVRLRDLATAEHVYQIVDPRLRADFPALRSLEATPNNLPQQPTSFVGRERELVEAKALLERARLVTLLGMGGLGKTRLSLHIAADLLDAYPDGVWFIDLAPLRDPSLVASVAAQALGVREEPGTPMLRTLCAHLRDHTALLIVDNCEHLIGACAAFADAILASAPKTRILATSREALHIAGEQTYVVLPLAVPDRAASADAVLQSDAVQLFVERARLHRPGFAPTARDAAAIAELCARLEGIPLALELAAARLRSLSIDEINKRLSDRFKLLTGGSRTALERQQTLRALVSWSYDLLRPPEQIVLDRLSTFVGGFDLEAAEAVCGAAPIDAGDVLDLVTSLVEKSLLMVEEADSGSRYGMLETIREFAHERRKGDASRYDMQKSVREVAQESLEARDDLAATSARHCDHYLRVAKQARAKLQSADQAAWTRRLEKEIGNMRAAISLALARRVDPVIAVKFEVALQSFRMLRGYSTEARANIRTALALPELEPRGIARAHALYVGGAHAMVQGDLDEAKRMLRECLDIRRGLGDRRDVAAALSTLATLSLQQGDAAQARVYEAEALAMFRELADHIGEAIGLVNLGDIELAAGNASLAGSLFNDALRLAQTIEYLELVGECHRKLGEIALDAGDAADAHARFHRSLATCMLSEDRRNEAIARACLARIDAACGRNDAARAALAQALEAFETFEMRPEALDALDDFAAVLTAADEAEDAAALLAATGALRASLALGVPARRATERGRLVEAMRARLGPSAFERAAMRGRSWTLRHAIAHARALAQARVPA